MRIFNLFKKQGQKQTSAAYAGAEQSPVTETKKENVSKPDTAKEPLIEGVKRVHNLIILDESGSMTSIYQPALMGVNETLQTIRDAKKENDGQEHFVSLVAFDTSHYNEIYSNTPAEKAIDITESQYCPHGGTPLYDAMGRSINELNNHVTDGDAVLVTVITDGYENSSREYTGKAIKALVEQMKAKGWIFTYIGSNQDVESVATSMSINNSLAFDADEEGTQAMFAKEMRCRKKLYSKLKHPDSCNDFSEGYFNE